MKTNYCCTPLASRTQFVRLVASLLLLLTASSSFGALKTWTGFGANANWSTSNNWSPAGQPNNGDDLSFPAGAAQLVNTNNLTRGFSSIAFSGAGGGYILRGNPIGLTNGLTAAHSVGVNTMDLTITNGASQIITATVGGTLVVSGDIALNGFILTINNSVATSISGLINGTGNLVKNGAGIFC